MIETEEEVEEGEGGAEYREIRRVRGTERADEIEGLILEVFWVFF